MAGIANYGQSLSRHQSAVGRDVKTQVVCGLKKDLQVLPLLLRN
ncbi:hypothetical protein [Acidiphilium cryptum]|nr:hypothetical protein [Acidiphilium cryptum]